MPSNANGLANINLRVKTLIPAFIRECLLLKKVQSTLLVIHRSIRVLITGLGQHKTLDEAH